MARGNSAYRVIPAINEADAVQDYQIGPLDTVNIIVFQEPDISAEEVVVDASGDISMPLIGRVHAAGLTTTELARELEQRLGERYYVDPQVTVVVATSVGQVVTIQGQVEEPGLYPLQGPTSLLDTLAMAKGETRIAALDEVVVFRVIDGQRTAALFDVNRIRRGEDDDPQIKGRDTVVVGFSNLKSAYRDMLQAAPLFNVFTRF